MIYLQHRRSVFLICIYFFLFLTVLIVAEDSVILPNKCEACVIFARELEHQIFSIEETKSKKRDELTLIEALEDHCEVMMNYRVHKEKQGLARFSKAQSSTIKTLHKLKDRGVKVELGMPYEMWDAPSAEIVFLKQQCELFIENYEEVIERWYNQKQRKPLQKFLCEERVLKGKDLSCLTKDSHSEL